MEFNDRRPNSVATRRAQMASQPFRLVKKGQGTVHVEGDLSPRTTGGGNDMGDHVSYTPDSHCAGLTRLGPHKATYSGHDTAADAMTSLQSGYAGKPCAKCTGALQRIL